MSTRQSIRLDESELFRRNLRIIELIGSGTFGDVYKAISLHNGKYVALKVESRTASNPVLKYEHSVYYCLGSIIGIPRVHAFIYNTNFNGLVMQLLGPSLEDMFNLCKRRFSLKTVLMLAEQIVERLQLVHQKGFVHRDIKPDNFVLGTGAARNQVHIIDFGMAKEFFDVHNSHIPMRRAHRMMGTARYASANALAGNELSRRDDMESLGYVLMYFLRGNLPWQGTKGPKPQLYERLAEKKLSANFKNLCQGYPQEFLLYLFHCRNINFDEAPNYLGIRRSFSDLFTRHKFIRDDIFDWHALMTPDDSEANKENKPEQLQDNKENEESQHTEGATKE